MLGQGWEGAPKEYNRLTNRPKSHEMKTNKNLPYLDLDKDELFGVVASRLPNDGNSDGSKVLTESLQSRDSISDSVRPNG